MNKFQCMLAGKVGDTAKLRYPVMVSPKLDGVRAIVIGQQFYSRNLKLIPNQATQLLAKGLPDGLDGELIVGDPTAPDAFRKTMSGVSSVDGDPEAVFHIFDYADSAMWFSSRYSSLVVWKNRSVPKGVAIVPHFDVKNEEELLRKEEMFLEMGYEGLMVRDPNGPYKHGRSTEREGWLLKLKRFCDGEAIVVGFEERQHNANEATRDALGRIERSSHKAGKVGRGDLGALKVKDVKTGVEFDIGTGFDDTARVEYWGVRDQIVGRVVKYKYFPTGSKEKPRFPVFLGFRSIFDC